MSSITSAIVLLKDIQKIESYDSLIRDAVSSLTEDGTLDILILFQISHLNTLDQILAETYSLATDILIGLQKTHVDVRVLFNEHYKELKSFTWELLIADEKDDALQALDFEDKDALEVRFIKRSDVVSKKIKLDQDEAEESSHKVVAVGGTFDHFHDGHKILLTAAAFLSAEKLIVGITDQELLNKKKFQEFLQSYDYRKHNILKFLNHIKPNLLIDPIAIRDVAGPTGYIEDIDALVVSRETVSGAEFINSLRAEKRLRSLKIHIINVIGGEEDDGFKNKLSSTQLREDEYRLTSKGGDVQ
jgi:pantetheine-phosphate adenylyltransferase